MRRRAFLVTLPLIPAALSACTTGADEQTATSEAAGRFEVTRTEEEWRKILTPQQFRVLRDHGTERPGSSPLNDEHRAGLYHCAGCDLAVAFDKVDVVLTTTSGYIGGRTANPTYEQVSSGGTGHTEALQVTYDPSRASYETLLRTFWHNVDPLDAGGQFCDRGRQYRFGIFHHSEEQRQQAEASKQRVAAQLGKPVVTEIVSAGPFYKAEEYHQLSREESGALQVL